MEDEEIYFINFFKKQNYDFACHLLQNDNVQLKFETLLNIKRIYYNTEKKKNYYFLLVRREFRKIR